MTTDLDAPDLEHVRELRGVLDLYLQEQDLLLTRDVVVLALLLSFLAYSSSVPMRRRWATRCISPLWAASSMKLLAISSTSIRSCLSSVERWTRDTREIAIIAPIKNNAMVMPSGRCVDVGGQRVDEDDGYDPEETVPGVRPPRQAVSVTAKPAEVIIARIPVA